MLSLIAKSQRAPLSKRLFASKITRQLPMKDMTLKEHDPELYKLIENEKKRQYRGIELIASENFTYKFVFESLGSWKLPHQQVQ